MDQNQKIKELRSMLYEVLGIITSDGMFCDTEAVIESLLKVGEDQSHIEGYVKASKSE